LVIIIKIYQDARSSEGQNHMYVRHIMLAQRFYLAVSSSLTQII